MNAAVPLQRRGGMGTRRKANAWTGWSLDIAGHGPRSLPLGWTGDSKNRCSSRAPAIPWSSTLGCKHSCAHASMPSTSSSSIMRPFTNHQRRRSLSPPPVPRCSSYRRTRPTSTPLNMISPPSKNTGNTMKPLPSMKSSEPINNYRLSYREVAVPSKAE